MVKYKVKEGEALRNTGNLRKMKRLGTPPEKVQSSVP